MELVSDISRARRVERAENVNTVSLNAEVWHPEQSVLLTGATIDQLAAIQ